MPSPHHEYRILVAHGVNLDLLGKREPHIYGHTSLAGLNENLERLLPSLCAAVGIEAKTSLSFFQTNSEENYLRHFDVGWSGALVNPGAWSHTSLAVADRLAALELPFVEVHLSNLFQRESFRQQSFLSRGALCVIQGSGIISYQAGLLALLSFLHGRNSDLRSVCMPR